MIARIARISAARLGETTPGRERRRSGTQRIGLGASSHSRTAARSSRVGLTRLSTMIRTVSATSRVIRKHWSRERHSVGASVRAVSTISAACSRTSPASSATASGGNPAASATAFRSDSLAHGPRPGIGRELLPEDPVGRLVAVEAGVEVRGGERPGRTVEAVEQVGPPHRPVDDEPLGRRLGPAVGLRFEQPQLQPGPVLQHAVGQPDLEPVPDQHRHPRVDEGQEHACTLPRRGRRRQR